MPIIITWDGGERQAFIGPNGAELLDVRYPIVKRFDNGNAEHLVKDKIRSVEDWTDEKWNKMMEAGQKKREEDLAAQELEAEALARKPCNRIKRLFGRKP